MAVVPNVVGLTRESAQYQLTGRLPAGSRRRTTGVGAPGTPRGRHCGFVGVAGPDGWHPTGRHEDVVLLAAPFARGVVIRSCDISKRDAELTVALTATGVTIAKKKLADRQTIRFSFESRRYQLTVRELDPDDGKYVVIAISTDE
jgi:hypothetical protein